MSFHSPLRSRERTLTSTLKISTISVLRHKVESSNRRSWCLWDLLWLWSYLHRLESIWEHSDQRYVTLFSKSMFFMVFLLFFNTCLSVAIDLESPMIDLHAPYTIQGMETEQSGFPTMMSLIDRDFDQRKGNHMLRCWWWMQPLIDTTFSHSL